MEDSRQSLFPPRFVKTDDDNFLILGTIEENIYVSVFHALSIMKHTKVVIKFVSSKYDFYKGAENGCKILKSISHPGIITIHDFFKIPNPLNPSNKERLVIIMDDYPDIDLFYYLRDNDPFGEPEATLIMKQLADSLVHLSGNGIVHKQIIPENILLIREQHPNEYFRKFHVTLTGFSASEIDSKRPPNIQSCSPAPDDPYAAPELMKYPRSTLQSDVFSLGIVFYELLTGTTPRRYIELYHPPNNDPFAGTAWKLISNPMKNLIMGMIHPEPENRLTPDQIIHHPVLQLVNENKAFYQNSIIEVLSQIPFFDDDDERVT